MGGLCAIGAECWKTKVTSNTDRERPRRERNNHILHQVNVPCHIIKTECLNIQGKYVFIINNTAQQNNVFKNYMIL
jgi:hypothetical protein